MSAAIMDLGYAATWIWQQLQSISCLHRVPPPTVCSLQSDLLFGISVPTCCCTQTPSLLPPHLLERILTTLQQQYSILPQAEISMEADPGTFDLARLQQYKALGVSRLSMGVQCFNQVCLHLIPSHPWPEPQCKPAC
jgi:hypothetical protein